MKAWVVSSSLFVPGKIMAPVRLTREIQGLKAREAKLETELQAIPAKIAKLSQQADELGKQYEPFKKEELL